MFLTTWKARVRASSQFYDKDIDEDKLQGVGYEDTIKYVVVLAKRIINNCKRYLEENDFKHIDKRYPNYLEETPHDIVKGVNYYLIEMEKCQRLLAQMRFDILCQFGQVEEQKTKSAPLNLARAMARQMLERMDEMEAETKADSAQDNSSESQFSFEAGLDYGCLR